MRDCWVVIPTFERCDLLHRTLRSLADAKLPRCVTRVVVAENGKASGAEAIAKSFAQSLPVEYQFTPKPNKSHTLNHVLAQANDQLIVYFDDDIRLDKNVLEAYTSASERYPDAFFCGPCGVDYETEPPGWLKPYLPPSARGWHLGDQEAIISTPDALGFNWGAFAEHLKKAGGFDERRGPGTGSRGQESSMQVKLLANGILGRYLPDAVVHHFVPRNRCNEDWCLDRIYQAGVGQGIQAREHSRKKRFTCLLRVLCRRATRAVRRPFVGMRLDDELRFAMKYWERYDDGLMMGLIPQGKPLPRESLVRPLVS